jgi:hypothetical protein
MLAIWLWVGSLWVATSDVHLVWVLGADNDLYPQARALVDSLRAENWPASWRFTLWLDGPGPRDTVYAYRHGLWQALPTEEWSPGDPGTLRNILIQAEAFTPPTCR